ncbi:MAG: FAD-dependent oxidoreductase [Paracoccaceae bacterium]|nr:FAD-dependent oxidoreductase [Paracoccaceae bacterium]MDG2258634.1 FAD-dependent oxidoreductase [Paracoccaceae bacterium]
MQRIKTDLLIIGAGSGGLSVAAGAAQMGANVVLLEGGEMGGDCLNYGCVPSKALLAKAKEAHLGLPVGYGDAMQHVQNVIAEIAPMDSQDRFEGFGVNVIREFGRFVSRNEVEAGDIRIKARRIVIATGSSPMVPPIPGLDSVEFLTNETIFALTDKPDHLLIVGAGPIGMEMAQAHIRLGSKVTVVDMGRALHHDDPELATVVVERLKSEGVVIIEKTGIASVSGTAGDIVLTLSDGSVVTGTHLLIAAGRSPNVAKLNLDSAGVVLDGPFIKTDDRLKTSNKKVYAIGDVNGRIQFTHAAGYQAGIVARSALFGMRAKSNHSHVPHATYTQPELAQIGLKEAEAREAYGDALEVVRFDLAHNDRAVAEGINEGLIKVMVVKKRPVGVSIVGQHAGELISLWSLAMVNKLTMAQISAMVAPYPTYAEINKRASGAYFIPRLFDNPSIKRVVRLVQRLLP